MALTEIANQTMVMLVLVLILSLPPILVASIVGTLFSLLQALTQIQEQTLAFAIKLIAVAITLALTATWIGSEMLSFTRSTFEHIERLE